MAIVHSEYVSPASPQVLKRWGHVVDPIPSAPLNVEAPKNPAVALGDPSCSPRTDLGLFTAFPRTLIVLSTHERLTHEVGFLVRAMQDDGVDISVERAQDGVHDVCIIADGWWDESVLNDVWERVGKWVAGV